MGNLPQEVLDRYANEMLQDKKVAADIDARALEDKTYAAIREAVKLDEKQVSVEEFNKLFAKPEEDKE